MDDNLNLNGNLEIEKALKEFETKSNVEQIADQLIERVIEIENDIKCRHVDVRDAINRVSTTQTIKQ